MILFLKKLLGLSNDKLIKKFWPLVEQINAIETDISQLSDSQLASKTPYFQQLITDGARLDDILVEAFAVVREVAKRRLNMRHFDVQLIGGMVLHQGKISEMRTGEGKTLVATLAAYLNALSGKGVHIITVNDYLASRDAHWMGPIYTFLGLSVGTILSNQDYEQKKQAYACDITYGTNNEFGFDYLRDNMALEMEQCVQRELNFAIVDEVDSILIDEARTPLIISGQVEGSVKAYPQLYKAGLRLQANTDYLSDAKQKNIALTEVGIEKIEKEFNLDSLYSVGNMDMAHILVQCLKAKEHFQKDIDYMVKDNEILIVDEFTGRLMIGRRYSDGLHQAIEAKEGVKVKDENQTLASITFQNYFRLYEKLSGMTGTAVTESEEFEKIYNLGVVEIPTAKPCIRTDKSDIIYKSKIEKYKAVASEVKSLNTKKIPVLVGTISIEASELLSTMLKRTGVVHQVLNAKYHEQEAEIISKAGQKGAVTIATNMAGRGTDIVLGAEVASLGGLHILGTERHESRRIDNQLRGRAGRQGDPGYTRFYISLEDELMKLFGSQRISSLMTTLGLPDDTPIENGFISRQIEKAQKKVEQYYFGIRKQVLKYDDVVNRQRKTIYGLRQKILKGQDIEAKLAEIIGNIAQSLSLSSNLEELLLGLEEISFSKFSPDVFADYNLHLEPRKEQDIANLKAKITEILQYILANKKLELGEEAFLEISKLLLLRQIDQKWMDHLANLDTLKEGIGLRAYGQRDPLMEYKVEGFNMFQTMLASIEQESLGLLLRVELTENIPELHEPIVKNISYGASGEKSQPQTLIKDESQKIGRNDSCSCGSGKKYKKCCGQ